jgi:4-hydroxy-3-methylbut-2-enyl diphosphate reductase
MEIILARPRGFCAGVKRDIKIVQSAIEKYTPPVYVLHEIVHNSHVIKSLAEQGAVFVEELEEIPSGSVTIFSAHGVSNAVVERAADRRLKVIDATCPLVTKVHRQAQRYRAQGRDIIVIGHAGHPEVEGTIGRVEGPVHVISTLDDVKALSVSDPSKLAYVTQTTLSTDDTRHLIDGLTERFPDIKGPDLSDICYATQSRQDAVRKMSAMDGIDLLLVVGSENSSNSNRLREAGESHGLKSELVDNAGKIDPAWLEGRQRILVTAGASAPEVLVTGVVDRIRELQHVDKVSEMKEENREATHFKMPELPDFPL